MRSTSARGGGCRARPSRAGGSGRSGGWIRSAGAGRSSRSATTARWPSCSRARGSRRPCSPPASRRPRCDGRGRARSSPTAVACGSGSTVGSISTTRIRTSIRWRSGSSSPHSTVSTSPARSASTRGTRSRSGRGAGPSWSGRSANVARRSPTSSMRCARSWSPWRRTSAGHPATSGPVIAISGPTTSGAPGQAVSASSTSTTPASPTRPRSSPLVLVEYGAEPGRAGLIRAAYAEAGGPGRVEDPTDFAMAIAQLSHIVVEGCRRWLAADDRRRTGRQRGLGPRVRRPAADPDRDRGAPGRLNRAIRPGPARSDREPPIRSVGRARMTQGRCARPTLSLSA